MFQNIWVRRVAWTLAALAGLWLLGWLAVPPLLKSQIETRASKALGRQLTLGAVDFKPWSLELTLTDLSLATADGSASQFKLARIYMDAELQSLVRMAPVVDAVQIDRPQIRLAHLGQGRYDIDDILARLKTPADSEPASPLRFALHNLVLQGGEVDFADHTATGVRQHALRKLLVAVPFLSNLESQRDVVVSPRLAFELNGSDFDTSAQGTPFALTAKGDAQLKISDFDLAPYLPYLPEGLPVRPRGAVVDADLKLGFERNPESAVRLTGAVTVRNLSVVDAAGAALTAVDSVRVELGDVRPLEQKLHLALVEVSKPRVQLVRERSGQFNWELKARGKPATAIKKEAADADSTGARGQKEPWSIRLDRFALLGGGVNWTDKAVQTPSKLALTELEVSASNLRWPETKTEGAQGEALVEASAKLPLSGGPASLWRFKAAGSQQEGSVQASVESLSLAVAAPYVAQYLEPGVRAMVDAQVGARWQGQQVTATVDRLSVREAALVDAKPVVKAPNRPSGAPARTSIVSSSDMPRFKLLEVSDVLLDPSKRSARVGKVVLQQASGGVRREADGRWMFESWLKPAPETAVAAADAPQGQTSTPWKVELGELNVQDSGVAVADRLPVKPVRLEMSAVNLQVTGAQLDGTKAANVKLLARARSGQVQSGTLRYEGTLAWAPVALQGAVEVSNFPAHVAVPYFADQLNVDVLRADASFKGQLRVADTPAGPQVVLRGDAAVDEFQALSNRSGSSGLGEELLAWKSLSVPGLELSLAPGLAARVAVREASLLDYYARIVVSPEGRINLQDLVKQQPSAPAQAGTAAPAAEIQVGPISLINGKVLFSDRFIKPNYTANLSDLTGKLSQFSSRTKDGVVQLADLELRGRAEGSATLEVIGKINPLAKPLALDIVGKVRELELPPLSPYSIRHAGYGIERGKMSVDVHYAVQGDGQLTADNKLVLNQLTFGDKVEGAPNSLPVKLAVALLADRNGVIDLDLPISGSLNDPQFSLGPVIWKAITNLLAKAITAPFSLIANALGGGGSTELSSVAFAPGSPALTEAAKAGLETVAKVLQERSALRVTVVGTAHFEAEREALKRERLSALLLAEKRRTAASRSQDAASVLAYSPEEMPVLLRAAYRRADIVKPRNLVGLAKDLDVPEMEALLLANISVNEDAIRDLALQRAVAVKDYLALKKVPTDRLFLGAVKTTGSVAEAKPHAELLLTSQ
jgi:uncharacterized protein involved in outer membrane biogenesis